MQLLLSQLYRFEVDVSIQLALNAALVGFTPVRSSAGSFPSQLLLVVAHWIVRVFQQLSAAMFTAVIK